MAKEKIIETDENQNRIYFGLSVEQRKEADSFLEEVLIPQVKRLSSELDGKYDPSSLEYKFQIGKCMNECVVSSGLNKSEYVYLWNEIKSLSSFEVQKCKDRSSKRSFLGYCQSTYLLPESVRKKCVWREASEIIDRFNLSDPSEIELIAAIAEEKEKLNKKNSFRMLMVFLRLFKENYDLSVYSTEELHALVSKYIVATNCWDAFLKKQFKTAEEKKKLPGFDSTKCRKKYVQYVLLDLKNTKEEQYVEICEADCLKVYNAHFRIHD